MTLLAVPPVAAGLAGGARLLPNRPLGRVLAAEKQGVPIRVSGLGTVEARVMQIGREGNWAAKERRGNQRREGCPPQRILGEQFAGDRFDRLISVHDGRTAAAARPLAAA